jgi:hypothetical protein
MIIPHPGDHWVIVNCYSAKDQGKIVTSIDVVMVNYNFSPFLEDDDIHNAHHFYQFGDDLWFGSRDMVLYEERQFPLGLNSVDERASSFFPLATFPPFQ